MKKDLKCLRVLYPIELNTKGINLKESDINSLSMLLFSEASYEYITSNLLSKRKFHIFKRIGLFKRVVLSNNRVTYKVSLEYENQVRDIYIKYYRMKFSKWFFVNL